MVLPSTFLWQGGPAASAFSFLFYFWNSLAYISPSHFDKLLACNNGTFTLIYVIRLNTVFCTIDDVDPCVNLRSWRTCDLTPECSFTFGCDRSGTKAVLTVGSRSLVRKSRLDCPFWVEYTIGSINYLTNLSH